MQFLYYQDFNGSTISIVPLRKSSSTVSFRSNSWCKSQTSNFGELWVSVEKLSKQVFFGGIKDRGAVEIRRNWDLFLMLTCSEYEVQTEMKYFFSSSFFSRSGMLLIETCMEDLKPLLNEKRWNPRSGHNETRTTFFRICAIKIGHNDQNSSFLKESRAKNCW